ncbi:MAG: 30S ribosomal protein S2, partial [Siphonobacter sp.]
DFPIPANDDAYKSISLITLTIGKAIEEGLLERKQDKDDARIQEEEEAKRAVDTAPVSEEAPVAAASTSEEEEA